MGVGGIVDLEGIEPGFAQGELKVPGQGHQRRFWGPWRMNEVFST